MDLSNAVSKILRDLCMIRFPTESNNKTVFDFTNVKCASNTTDTCTVELVYNLTQVNGLSRYRCFFICEKQ